MADILVQSELGMDAGSTGYLLNPKYPADNLPSFSFPIASPSFNESGVSMPFHNRDGKLLVLPSIQSISSISGVVKPFNTCQVTRLDQPHLLKPSATMNGKFESLNYLPGVKEDIDNRGRKSPTGVSERSSSFLDIAGVCDTQSSLKNSENSSDSNSDNENEYVLEPHDFVDLDGYDSGDLLTKKSSGDKTDSRNMFGGESKTSKRSSSSDDTSEISVAFKRARRLNHVVPYPRRPRLAEYNCSKCSKAYQTTVPDNPWWATYRQECHHCGALQIPRLDISSPANNIETDPNVAALYGDSECSGDQADDDDDGDDGLLDEDFAFDETDSSSTETAAETLMDEVYPFDKPGNFSTQEAASLLVLMNHSRTCIGRHSSSSTEEVCKSVKLMMLHLRDCFGVDVSGREKCKFGWCQPAKSMLFHLTHCAEPSLCGVCSPSCLSSTLGGLSQANQIRMCESVTSASSTTGCRKFKVEELSPERQCRDTIIKADSAYDGLDFLLDGDLETPRGPSKSNNGNKRSKKYKRTSPTSGVTSEQGQGKRKQKRGPGVQREIVCDLDYYDDEHDGHMRNLRCLLGAELCISQ